ncbi:DNA polymerase epsilon subunit 4 [Venturia canescens]|uniref:DNA polymerase epsilon subunit 4 n=1 Tax=Venturia canescens TaxID=32260 RepID=UPI001C9D5DAD|nr:DNA polymerase epsilon subunit 4 [Venturia canescens]XP_043284028.1 DNA polymerase epsilon subunit 4 [Venturia canescens]XP_043284038.1 DNA polymerase epsilon subunit 4 [Venturia canescens]XP_043284046.1 DNA polymerase epsilon subunit 4 [Venturia canescens]XP_043284055.1 DNA polymerase epsilon subunit 4 [Venturia canescens]XP_043284064.1 DNA polymerase epsilon subunit 4 [Venturia canescens]XP_043284075.1 DNA polymerase epsilon subunit 4 [Venturia canescens]
MSSLEFDQLPGDISLNESSVSSGADKSQESLEEPESVQHADQEQREKLVKLPVGRIRNIVKMDPDVNIVTGEAIFAITKSVELFIDSLAKEAYKYTAQSKKKTVQKKDVESAIDNVDALVFLEGMLDSM